MQNVITELEELTLTSAAKFFLKEIAKWSKFLSILGFIGIGVMLIGSLSISAIYNNMPQSQMIPFNFGGIITLIYVAIALIYLFPIYYLYQFSVQMSKALISKDDKVLASSFEMLKSYYKFIGVFAIIIISIYLLVFIGAMLAF